MVNAQRAAALASLVALGSGACDTELDPSPEGLACRARAPRCLPGYVCSASERCVPEGSAGLGGAGGAGEAGGGGDAGAPPGPAGGAAGSALDAGSGGYRYDAGPGLDALDASVLPDAAGCDAPVLLFRDEDEDGFGVTAQAVVGCPEVRWAPQGGDCRDDLPEVHPGQTELFETGYVDPTRPQAGGLSFDYDCDFVETAAPGVAPAPTCDELLTCEGSGYVAVNPARTGPGINGLCGSTELATCQSRAVPLLGLTCATEPLSGAAPARCR